uniref:Uncharacterized protein n=1 Tax=Magallana gigas TaxID=29159 RepID=K1R5X1_MAGGI
MTDQTGFRTQAPESLEGKTVPTYKDEGHYDAVDIAQVMAGIQRQNPPPVNVYQAQPQKEVKEQPVEPEKIEDFGIGIQECKSTINRTNSHVDYTVTVCCKVTCEPGFFVDVCKVNGTADRCKPCPEGTYLDDITHSELLLKCRTYDCPPESIPASTFPPEPACRKRCVCDVQRRYVGSDPCACKRATVTCPHGKSLTIDNTCEPIEQEVTPTTNDPSSTGYFMTTRKENPEYTGRISSGETTVNRSVTVPSHDLGSNGDNGLVTILVPVLVILFVIVMPVVIGVLCYKKKKESRHFETVKLNDAAKLSLDSLKKEDKEPLSYDLESVEPLSKPEEMPTPFTFLNYRKLDQRIVDRDFILSRFDTKHRNHEIKYSRNNCYAACRGHPFTCGAHNHCHCHNPDTCDSHSGPVCLSSECGGTRKCVESKCHCEYHCSGVDDCRNFPCKFGTPECADKMCSCNDPSTTPRPTTTATTAPATTTTTTAATTTTAPQTSTPSGVACTTTSDCKNSNYTVSWNPFEFVICENPIWRTCTAGYCVCDKTLKADCVLIQGLLTTENIQCCEDAGCVNGYFGG